MTDKSKVDPMAVAATPLSGVTSVSGPEGERMTSKQADELRMLCEKHGEAFNGTLSRDEAAARITALRGEVDTTPPHS